LNETPGAAGAGEDPLPGHSGRARVETHGETQSKNDGEDLVARAVFGLLVLACFAALIATQRLKHTPTAVQNFEMTGSFQPTGKGRHVEERVSFKLAKADEVTVRIVNTKGDEVATLVREVPAPRYKQFSLRWNGRMGVARGYRVLRSAAGHESLLPANTGRLAPVGEYRVSVSLRRQHRSSVLSPRSFKLVGP
jgi:hypothetical protein